MTSNCRDISGITESTNNRRFDSSPFIDMLPIFCLVVRAHWCTYVVYNIHVQTCTIWTCQVRHQRVSSSTQRRSCCSTRTTAETRSTWHGLTAVEIISSSSATPSIRERYRSTPCAGRNRTGLTALLTVHRVKWRHSNLWSRYDFRVICYGVVLCEVNWWSFFTLFK